MTASLSWGDPYHGVSSATGRNFAATLVLFVVGFLMLEIAQPISGALFALVGVGLALRLPEHATPGAPISRAA